ncbi:MAG: 50S ribosomal protein L4 [Bacteroidota bacterium]
MQIDLLKKDGSQAGKIELNDEVFGVKPNEHAMHMAVVAYLANQRQGTAKVKARSEVSGGGKKPWRQKGRGTARAGSTRSPIWVGGGTIHGPIPRDYTMKLPKKLKQLAKKSALSLKCGENNLFVVEDFKFDAIKTKQMTEILKNLNLDSTKILILLPNFDDNIYLSTRNIANVSIYPADKISTYHILSHKKILLLQGAVELIENSLKN